MKTPEEFDLGPLCEVSYDALDDGRCVLTMTTELPHDVERVWKALTDPQDLREWAPFVPDRDLSSTGPATLTMFDDGQSVDLPGNVQRSEPPTYLEYTWDHDLLQWSLEAIHEGTRLVLRHTVENAGWLDQVSAGWHISLVSAGYLLAGDPSGNVTGRTAMEYGWESLRAQYANRLGL
jgi:uncharacterized protein YndB with AHSA1/START domain